MRGLKLTLVSHHTALQNAKYRRSNHLKLNFDENQPKLYWGQNQVKVKFWYKEPTAIALGWTPSYTLDD